MPKRANGPQNTEQRVPFSERVTCSVADAEKASGISRSRLYEEMRNGKLQYTKRGTRRLVRVSSLLKLLDAT